MLRYFGSVCHWLSQLHPGIRMQLGKASEPEGVSLLHITRPNTNALGVKVAEVK